LAQQINPSFLPQKEILTRKQNQKTGCLYRQPFRRYWWVKYDPIGINEEISKKKKNLIDHHVELQ